MAKITMTEVEEFTILPADTVITVRVESSEVKPIKGAKGDWEKLDIKFKIIDAPERFRDEVVDAPIWGGVPFRLTEHPDNKLRQWCEALFGVELEIGFELDTDMLVGREAKAIVGNYPRKLGGEGHQVAALIPMGATNNSNATAQEAILGAATPQPQYAGGIPAPSNEPQVGSDELPF